MIYGYARVSTKGQAKDGNSLDAQEIVLRTAGATEIYADAFTGTKAHRPELDKWMKVMFIFLKRLLTDIIYFRYNLYSFI